MEAEHVPAVRAVEFEYGRGFASESDRCVEDPVVEV